MARELGAELAARLDPGYPRGNPVILTPGEAWTGDGLGLAEQIAGVRDSIGLAVEASGSNNWAVTGARSATGGPLLAGDPHLPPSMPGITYQVGLYLEDRFCRGASLPGAARRVHGPEQRPRVVVHQRDGRRHGPVHRADRRRHLRVRGRVAAPGADRGGDRGQGARGARAPGGPRDPPRPDRQRGAPRRRRGAAGAALHGPRLPRRQPGQPRGARLHQRRRPGARRSASTRIRCPTWSGPTATARSATRRSAAFRSAGAAAPTSRSPAGRASTSGTAGSRTRRCPS